MFKHELLPHVKIESTTLKSGRTYHTPDGDFPSVTTIISKAYGAEWLEAWKSRVGEEEVQRVSRIATARGTSIHLLAEKYVNNDTLWKKGSNPFDMMTFSQIKRVLDDNLSVVMGIEHPLWSTELKAAGRTDLIGIYSGDLSIVDYKTSKKIKNEEDVKNYFIQLTTYSMMLQERTGLEADKIVVIMACDESSNAIVFVKSRKDYIHEVKRIFVNERPIL